MLKNRPRRIRSNEFSRRLTSESQLSIDDLIYPMFVIEGEKIREEIESMPGTFRLSIDELINEATECYKLGIPAIALFPVIDDKIKTLDASESFNSDGLIPRTIKAVKKAIPKLGLITYIAHEPYTSHGQDGLTNEEGIILNDETVTVLVKQALSHARAGANVLAPYDMRDGRG